MFTMKRILFYILGLLLTVSAVAQPPTPKFKGLDISGDVEVFVSKLEKEGFKVSNKGETSYFLKGPFVGYSNCSVYVKFLKSTRQVEKVTVRLPHCDTWAALEGQYNTLRSSYIEKYGNPSSEEHSFDWPYKLFGGKEIQAILDGKCKYGSNWRINGFYIFVGIEQKMPNLRIVYTNIENQRIGMAESNISKDI